MTEVQEVQPVKKGRPSWRPAHMLDLVKKTPGFRYRFCNNQPDNLEKKWSEGWRLVNRATGAMAEHYEEYAQITGGLTYRGMVVMALPEELAKEREAFFDKKTRQQTASIKQKLQTQIDEAADAARAPRAKVEGRVTIIE